MRDDSSWWNPLFKLSWLKMVEPRPLIKMPSMTVDGCLRWITALFANLISTHSLTSFPLGTITDRFL